MPDDRSAEQIERDLEAARRRLAENLSQLVVEVHPKAVVRRSVAEGKRRAREAVAEGRERVQTTYAQVKSHFKDEEGWNLGAVAVAGGATAAVILVVVAIAAKKR